MPLRLGWKLGLLRFGRLGRSLGPRRQRLGRLHGLLRPLGPLGLGWKLGLSGSRGRRVLGGQSGFGLEVPGITGESRREHMPHWLALRRRFLLGMRLGSFGKLGSRLGGCGKLESRLGSCGKGRRRSGNRRRTSIAIYITVCMVGLVGRTHSQTEMKLTDDREVLTSR